jgi:hypothetical protein
MKNKIEQTSGTPRKELKLLDSEIIEKICTKLATELENLYTDPQFPSLEEDLDSVKKIKAGQKVKATRILLDKIARIVGDMRIRYTIVELQKLYDVLTTGWETFVEVVDGENE